MATDGLIGMNSSHSRADHWARFSGMPDAVTYY
jgi:hypothetical protein